MILVLFSSLFGYLCKYDRWYVKLACLYTPSLFIFAKAFKSCFCYMSFMQDLRICLGTLLMFLLFFSFFFFFVTKGFCIMCWNYSLSVCLFVNVCEYVCVRSCELACACLYVCEYVRVCAFCPCVCPSVYMRVCGNYYLEYKDELLNPVAQCMALVVSRQLMCKSWPCCNHSMLIWILYLSGRRP